MTTYVVGGVVFETSPIMIGAGVCKAPSTTKKWLEVAPVVSGSYTPERRDGNEGEKLFYPDTWEELLEVGYGLNSFGMPNMGFTAAASQLSTCKIEQALIVSVAGFSVEDYFEGVLQFESVETVAAIELNFGCPNTDHGKIMSFDVRSLERLFKRLEGSRRPIWAKFSVYSDPGLLKEVASVVNACNGAIKAVVTCNTLANAYAGPHAISPAGGLAGLSGPALKPIARGQIQQFRKYLHSEIDVIGVGGITTGNDVVDYLDDGANGVQLTSLPFWLGSPVYFWPALLDSTTGSRLNKYLGN